MKLFEAAASRKALTGQGFVFLAWAVTTGLAAWMEPNSAGYGTHRQLGLPPCGAVALAGRPCPGCGLTTSWTATVHGAFGHAFQAHPFGTFLYVLFTVYAILALYGWLSQKHLRLNDPLLARAGTGLLAVFMIYGVARFLLVRYR